MKGYKGFDENLQCRGFQYEVGKTYELNKGKLNMCENGFHFCKKLSWVHEYYSLMNEKTRVCEVEALDVVKEDGNKCVTDRIKIVRELTSEEIENMKNEGVDNTGVGNTGDRNTGDRNTGNWNTGDSNTGDSNTGDRNTGDRNTGNWNTGYRNTGNWNTGNWNTGYRNTGNWNTGNWNTGDSNTGDWNKTNRSTGVFCNQEPKLMMFNKPTDMTFTEWRNTEAYDILMRKSKSIWIDFGDMTEEEKEKYPSAECCGGYLKEIEYSKSSEEWWEQLTDEEKLTLFQLPNFDLEVFNDIMALSITQEEYKRIKERKERIKLSEAEKIILENIDEKYKWIARDKSEKLFLFSLAPHKESNFWTNYGDSFCTGLGVKLFQFIKWEDEKPYNIAELLK